MASNERYAFLLVSPGLEVVHEVVQGIAEAVPEAILAHEAVPGTVQDLFPGKGAVAVPARMISGQGLDLILDQGLAAGPLRRTEIRKIR